MKYTAEEIARIVHAANAEHNRIIGDPVPHERFFDMPGEDRSGMIDGIMNTVGDPSLTSAGSHIMWMADKQSRGWKYGPEKDFEKKTHPCMVPYDELSEAHRVKDSLFQAIVRALGASQ